MRNPRRDAVEYGIFLSLLGTMVIGAGILTVFGWDESGRRKKLDLGKPFGQTLREVQTEWTKAKSGGVFGTSKNENNIQKQQSNLPASSGKD